MPASLPYRLAKAIPSSVRRKIHEIPAINRFVMGIYGWAVGNSIETVESGPMKGVNLATGRHISHAHVSGSYEIEVLEALDRYVPSGGVCYDLGASVGYMTLFMAQRARLVYSFEPAPHAAAELQRQVETNGLTNVTLIQKPVSDTVASARLAVTDAAYGAALVEQNEKWPMIEVETTTLDLFVETHEMPDFLKIDIEGFEGRALSAGKSILQGKRPAICCEVHSSSAAREVLAALDPYSYRITDLEGKPFDLSAYAKSPQAAIVHVMAFPT